MGPEAQGVPARRLAGITLAPGSVLRARADYYHGRIDLKAFRARHPSYPALLTDPLVLEPAPGSYAVLTKFGGLVCWNCDEDLQRTLRTAVSALPGSGDRSAEVSDEAEIVTGQPEESVGFDRIELKELTLDRVKLISVALAQSVALEYFENRVREALARSEPIVVLLRREGRLRLTETQVLKAVGFALEVRSAVLANLTLFDSPPEAWESAAISRLDAQLFDHFDLDERLVAIKEQLTYFADLNAVLLNLLANRKSRNLEWIVITLIAVEILLFILLELPRR